MHHSQEVFSISIAMKLKVFPQKVYYPPNKSESQDLAPGASGFIWPGIQLILPQGISLYHEMTSIMIFFVFFTLTILLSTFCHGANTACSPESVQLSTKHAVVYYVVKEEMK